VDTILLVVYLFIALIFSFLCSVFEAVLLSVRRPYLATQREARPANAATWEKLLDDINRPLSAILILSEIIPKTLGGVFPGEKSGQITLREANGKSRKIKSSDIKNRRDIIPTTPPMGQILTKREIRDLVEYLSSLKTKK
jgi:hypothetical protein